MDQIEGVHYKSKDYIKVSIDDGLIKDISLSNNTPVHNRNRKILVPGLFDIQVNGYAGIDFNDINTTTEDILEATKALNEKGTLKFLPTIITNSYDNISKLIRNIVLAIEKYERCRYSIVGIHLEGPFLSKQDGPRGAHFSEYIRKPDLAYVNKWIDESHNLIKIITLSPEYTEAYEVIQYCKSRNIICSIGHTAASANEIKKAIYHGATMSTHLGNGSHLHLPRHENYFYEQAASDYLTASLIADGIHLPKTLLENLLTLKKNNAVLVSDSSAIAGLVPGVYETHIGGKVLLDESNRLCLFNNPQILAGSAMNLMEEVAYVTKNEILSFSDAVYMASEKPASLLNESTGFTVGNNADFLVCDISNNQVELIDVIVKGTSILK